MKIAANSSLGGGGGMFYVGEYLKDGRNGRFGVWPCHFMI